MSAKVFKYVLVISNLILITFVVVGIVLSYVLLNEDIVKKYNIKLGLYTIAFSTWGLVLILTSICLLGIVFTRVICLHLLAALFLCCPLALAIWLIVEQFLFRDQPNATVIIVCLIGSTLWIIQIFSELILACIICCSPRRGGKRSKDAEEGKEELKEVKEESNIKEINEQGTDEEKEKLVIAANEAIVQQARAASAASGTVRSEEEEETEEAGDEDRESVKHVEQIEEEYAEEETCDQFKQATHEQTNLQQTSINHPQDLPLETIPEERQNLLNHSVQCPLATPEDTGV